MPYKEGPPALRPRPDSKEPKWVTHAPPPVRTQIGWLEYGLQTRKHERKGWLKEELLKHKLLVDNKAALWARVLSDYACTEAGREGMEKALGKNYVDPREHKGAKGKQSGGRFISLKKQSQIGVPKNIWTLGYLVYAYGVDKMTFRRRWKAAKEGITKTETVGNHVGTSVINNRKLARERYDAKFFYAREHALQSREATEPDQKVREWQCHKYRVAYWGRKFDENLLTNDERAYYERLAREHDDRQPYVQQDILDALINGHSCHSYRALSKQINNWCSPWTIHKWLTSHPSYYIYSKNIKPGLSEPNKVKQVEFSKHVRNRWGLPPGKFLWIHSDEKWFHALVPRQNAKACEELGLRRQSYSVHHKSHIKKVMAHCTVGYLFDTNVEDGGEGFLIGLHRCANFKVPLRDVRFSSKDPTTGRISFAGNEIKHKKGEPYLVDCNVTGMNAGTTTMPCFPLRSLWEHSLFPAIEAMVAPDGPCAGAQVIFQEDNAGPHTNLAYTAWMQEAFAQHGWRIELQAPQGITMFCTLIITFIELPCICSC